MTAAPDLLELVRRAARGRPVARDAVPSDGAAWRATEGALERELQTSPKAAADLIAAFEDLARSSGLREARGRAARLRASWLAYTGRFADSLAAYDGAARNLRGAARDGARIGRAGALLRLGRFDEARDLCRAVRRAARGRGDALLAAAADLNEGVARHEGGQVRSAVALYRRAAEQLAACGHRPLAATARQNLGNALVLLDRWDEALPEIARAQQEFDALGLLHEAARCALNRGALLAAADRLGEADEILRGAERTLAESDDRPQAALCRLDRGETLLRAGLTAEAVHVLERAQSDLRRGVPPAERRRGRRLLARAALRSGDATRARRLLRRPSGNETTAARAERLALRGELAARDGRWRRAADLLEEAAALTARSRPDRSAQRAAAAAHCRLLQGDVARARTLARRAEARAVSHRTRFAALAVRFLLSADHGRADAAERFLEASSRELAHVRDGLGPDAFRAALLEGRQDWLARAVRFLIDREPDGERALAFLERFRARALLDLTASSGRVARGPEDLDALRLRVAALERRTAGGGPAGRLRDPAGGTRAASPEALRVAETALRDALQRARPPGLHRAFDLRTLRDALAPRTACLYVHSDDAGTCLFLVTGEGLHLIRTPVTDAQVREMVETLRFRFRRFTAGPAFVQRHAGRLRRDTDRALAPLSDALLGPLREQLADLDELIVVPGGPWNDVPLPALPHAGRPLVAAMRVRRAPALAALATDVPRALGAPVVCGYADELAPAIEDELRQVAAVLPRSRRLLGSDATFPRLRERVRPRCLHLAAHGRHRSDAPAMSGLQLHDGWLRAADLALLDLRGSLVVLAGCETGVSQVRAGDELHGLVRGAFAAGASELVASLWRVDDAATTELMVRFHAARDRGASSSAALAAAQNALAAAGRHPWYWAGFQLWSRRIRG